MFKVSLALVLHLNRLYGNRFAIPYQPKQSTIEKGEEIKRLEGKWKTNRQARENQLDLQGISGFDHLTLLTHKLMNVHSCLLYPCGRVHVAEYITSYECLYTTYMCSAQRFLFINCYRII